jgi:predicted nucleic acid-binding protein
MSFVLDASVTASWILPDESNADAERVLDLLATKQAFVPMIWWYEIRNLLVMSERRQRVNAHSTDRILADLAAYPIAIDQHGDEAETLRIARIAMLTFYDAAYVELALRRRLPLATLDRAMAAAAASHGVPGM